MIFDAAYALRFEKVRDMDIRLFELLFIHFLLFDGSFGPAFCAFGAKKETISNFILGQPLLAYYFPVLFK